MKIGIDCRTILNPQKGEAAGVGHYTYQLVRHLIKLDKKNEYILFFDRRIREKKMTKFLQPNVRVKFFPFVQYKNFLPFAYSHLLISSFLAREKLDLYHSPILHLPLSYFGPSVVTAHDLAIYKYPRLFPKGQYLSTKVLVPQALKRAKKIIAVSKSTKKDLQDLFKISEKKIKVVHNGLDERFFNNTTKQEIKRIKNKYNILGDYVLFLGTLEPRKNVERLIEAFELLHLSLRGENRRIRHLAEEAMSDDTISQNSKNQNLQLVIAGKKGWGVGKILKRISRSFRKKDIILTDYIEAEDLNTLLAGAKVFVFPSLYEGFGMPVTEAMSKGVPVITSKNAGSLEEISANAALFIDPYKPKEVAKTIKRILSDSRLAQELSEKGLARARNFSWDKCAQETLEVYKNF